MTDQMPHIGIATVASEARREPPRVLTNRNQPRIAHWNLARFAETLLRLLDDNPGKAIAMAADTVNQFPASFERSWREGMRRKLLEALAK